MERKRHRMVTSIISMKLEARKRKFLFNLYGFNLTIVLLDK